MAEIPIRSFLVSVIVLRQMGDGWRVLLMRRTQSLVGEWCQVAGGIEQGETAWQAGLRELREETGLTPVRFYSADICEQFYEADRDAITMAPVFVAYVETDQVQLNEEHSEFTWMSFDAAIDAVPFAGQRHVLRHVEAEFIQRVPHPHLEIALPHA